MKKNKKILLGPVITIILITIIVMFLSFIFSILGLEGEVTSINNNVFETSLVTINSIFSVEGLKFFFSSQVDNFKTFEPLVLIIISLMAISIGKSSGLFKAVFTPFRNLKSSVITFLTLLVGIISTAMGDYGYIIFIPLVAVMYQYIGKNSVLGVITAFIGITMGYGAGIVFNFDDYSLGLLTRLAAVVTVDDTYKFSAWSNIYIMLASTAILSIFGTLIIENILKPKIKPAIEDETEYKKSPKGLKIVTIVFFILIGSIIYSIIPSLPGSGLLLDKTQDNYIAQLFGDNSLFMSSIIYIFLLVMMVCSGIYGYASKNLKNTNDFSVGLSKEFDNLGYIFVLMFFASLMISILEWTNLGEVIGSWLITLISIAEFTGLPLIIMLFLIVIFISILIPDSTAKWAILSPIVVPLFMKANLTPDFAQYIFKAADSIGKCITPFFVYFLIMLAFIEKYNSKENVRITVFGTFRLMLPTILLFIIVWLLIIVGWFILGLPLGPGVSTTV